MPARTKCPCFGFEPTPTNRQLLRRFRIEFRDIPVMEMIGRGWLGEVDKADISAVEAALLRFFEVATKDELWELLSKPPTALVCKV